MIIIGSLFRLVLSAYGVNSFEDSSAHHHTTEAVLANNEAGWYKSF